MLEIIRQLLELQNCDLEILSIQSELDNLEPQRTRYNNEAAKAQEKLEREKQSLKEYETRRHSLEVEVEGKKKQIERYSLQQFQTKKNEEYRALSHEIDTCKNIIDKLDDEQLELMEQAEATQKQIEGTSKETSEVKDHSEKQIQHLNDREQTLRKRIGELKDNRSELVNNTDTSACARYERLWKSKEQKVVVPINNGVCGGCHMQIPPQTAITCQTSTELVHCPNCSRILYVEN